MGDNMKLKRFFLYAALVLVFVLCILWAARISGSPLATAGLVAAGLGGLLAGTATVTYKYPIGGATPPTRAQVGQRSMVTATVQFGDTDTTAVITHNLALTASDLLLDFALPLWYIITPGTVVPLISFSNAANAMTITKASATGSNCTILVAVERPSTVIR